MKIIKIALLIADRPADVVVAQYGDYNKMFKDLLSAGCLSLRNRQQADLEVEWTSFDLHKLQIPTNPQQFDAMLITGSKCSAYDSDEWIQRLKQFIRQTATDAPKVKWIGICFGHQVICEALGGKVTPNPKGWEVGWTEIQLIPAAAIKLLNTSKQSMRIQQMHKDEVSVIPEGFQLYATTQHSTNQALIKPGHILTIQSHPEYPAGAVRALINLRHEKGIFTAEQRDRWLPIVDNPTDGQWFAEKILGFICGEMYTDS